MNPLAVKKIQHRRIGFTTKAQRHKELNGATCVMRFARESSFRFVSWCLCGESSFLVSNHPVIRASAAFVFVENGELVVFVVN